MAYKDFSGLVTLTTDFGRRDPFVGLMHAALYDRAPDARVVDLTHEVPPQDVVTAGFWLERSIRHLPEGTVHVAVVDPGVGSARKALVASVDGHWFIGPDNGLFGAIFAAGKNVNVRWLRRRQLGIGKLSKTFHGRDLFAPAAAELMTGRVWITEFPEVEGYVASPVPAPTKTDDGAQGAVVVVDHFGNLITNLSGRKLDGDRPAVTIETATGPRAIAVGQTYADVEDGQLIALVNSFNRVEIACRNGSAARVLELGRGAGVAISPGA